MKHAFNTTLPVYLIYIYLLSVGLVLMMVVLMDILFVVVFLSVATNYYSLRSWG